MNSDETWNLIRHNLYLRLSIVTVSIFRTAVDRYASYMDVSIGSWYISLGHDPLNSSPFDVSVWRTSPSSLY